MTIRWTRIILGDTAFEPPGLLLVNFLFINEWLLNGILRVATNITTLRGGNFPLEMPKIQLLIVNNRLETGTCIPNYTETDILSYWSDSR